MPWAGEPYDLADIVRSFNNKPQWTPTRQAHKVADDDRLMSRPFNENKRVRITLFHSNLGEAND